MRRGFLTTSVALMALVAGSQTAFAQASPAAEETSDADSGDIVVTAQRRSESLQDVPLAVSAISGENIAATGRSTIESLSGDVPGLNVTQNIAQARITIRGIGTDSVSIGTENSIAFFTDGVFRSRSSSGLASFFDIDRVEVLRGPQGTLYGRNATGGSINVITKRPTDTLEGYIGGTVGNYRTLNSEGAISGPLGGNVSGRLAFQTRYHRGFGTNIATGNRIDSENTQAIRGQLKFDLDRVTILLSGDYYRKDDSSNGSHNFGIGLETAPGVFGTLQSEDLGGIRATNPRDLANARDPFVKAEFYGGMLDITYEASDSLTLRSLSAYRGSSFDSLTDIVGASYDLFPLFNFERDDQFSQEFQLNHSSDRNELVVGLYYLHDKVNGGSFAPFAMTFLPPIDRDTPADFFQGYNAGGILKTDAFAIFGQDTLSLSDQLRLTVGARYSYEKKRVNNVVEFQFAQSFDPDYVIQTPFRRASDSFESFTPKIGLEYDVNNDVLLYASFSKGFKAGTYDLQAIAPAVNPEKVDAIDFGLKSKFADGVVTANLAGFYYDYKDLQVGKVTGAALVLENAATAEVYGLEAEVTVRPREIPLTLYLNGSWLSAKYKDYISVDPARLFGDGVTLDEQGQPAFDLRGNTLPQAPRYTINVGFDYDIETSAGTFTLHADSQFVGKTYFNAFNREIASQDAYSFQNAYLSFQTADRDWTITAFVRNIANKTVISSARVGFVPVGAPIQGILHAPRTFGLSIRKDF